MPSYVTLLKENGVKNPQGEYNYQTTSNVSLTKQDNVCPNGQILAKSLLDCDSNPFSCTYLRIIQKNCEIIPLTEENGNIIDKDFTPVYANKRDLAVFETEIYNKIGVSHLGVYILNDLLLKFAEKRFRIYLNKTVNQKRYIVIEKKDKKNKVRKFIPIDSRFSKTYQKKVRKRMNWLIVNYGNVNAVNLTLTIDPKKYKHDKFKMWKSIKKELNRFLTALRYYFNKKSIPFPPYICTIEAQKNGNPHLHFVFLNSKRLLDWRKIKKLWGLGRTYLERTYQGYKIKHPINYITKYITKTFTKTDKENVLTQSLCWLFHIRSFSTSRGLIIPINPVGLGDWKPICLIIGNEFFELSEITDFFDLKSDFDGG